MRRRKLLIALATAALFGRLVRLRSAELRSSTSRSATARSSRVAVDVPAGTPRRRRSRSPACPRRPRSRTTARRHADAGPAAADAPAPTPEPTPPARRPPTPAATPRRSTGDGHADGRGGASIGRGDAPRRRRAPGRRRRAPGRRDRAATRGRVRRAAGPARARGHRRASPPARPRRRPDALARRRPGAGAASACRTSSSSKFRIPPFLLPIYQAAGIQYGVRWEVLAAINEIETDYGRNLNVSLRRRARLDAVHARRPGRPTASTRNQRRRQGPLQPGRRDLRRRPLPARRRRRHATCARAIFAYNHADWYVDSVLMRARLIGGLPADLVGSLTGLTQGRFPVDAKAPYAGAVSRRDARGAPRRATPPVAVESSDGRRGIAISRARGAPWWRSTTAGSSGSGRASGSAASSSCRTSTATRTPTRASARSRERYPAPEAAGRHRRADPPASSSCPARRRARRAAASADAPGARRPTRKRAARRAASAAPRPRRAPPAHQGAPVRQPGPARRARAGGDQQQSRRTAARRPGPRRLPPPPLRPTARTSSCKRLRRGARVAAGTILGRLGATVASARRRTCSSRSAPPAAAPRASTRSRSSTAGSCSSRPPSTAPRAATRSSGADAADAVDRPDPADEQGGARAAGAAPTRASSSTSAAAATSARARSTGACWPRSSSSPPRACGRPSARCSAATATSPPRATSPSTRRATRSTSRRSTAIPIAGHQGAGSITESTIQRLLTLQGTMKPAPDHQPDDLRGDGQHVRDGRPRRPHPRRLAAAVRRQRQPRAGRRGPQAAAVDQADRPPRARSTTRRVRRKPSQYAVHGSSAAARAGARRR